MNDGGLLDTVLNNFQAAISGAWGPALSSILYPLLLGLVVLQVGLFAIDMTVTRDAPLVLMHAMLGVIRLGVVIAIFQHSFDWGNAIVQTGQDVGGQIAGLSPAATTPSGVFNNGLQMVQTIFAAKAAGSWLHEIIADIEFVICGLMVGAAWAIASGIYMFCLMETLLVVYTGPLIICFTPISWTFDMLVLWGKSLLQIAFKVALILMTLAVAIILGNNWVAATAASATTLTTDIWNLLIAVVEAGLFLLVVWKVPNKISGLAGGAAILGLAEGVIAMGAGAAGNAVSSTFTSNTGGGGASSSTSNNTESSGAGAAQAIADAGKALANKIQVALRS